MADERIRLVLYAAELDEGEPEAGPPDHDALRWIGLDELDVLDWLPIDRRLLASACPM